MNYVATSISFLISVFSNVITWLFTTEILTYQSGLTTRSVSIGETLVYFFIVYLVISFLLGARFGNIGTAVKKNKKNNGPAKISGDGVLNIHAYDKDGNEYA